MHRTITRMAIFFLSVVLLTACSNTQATDVPLSNTTAQVFFSPKGGCTDAIVKEISQARSEILVQAYSFTSAPIANALVNAHKRGVHVEVVLDKSQRSEKYSSADFTAHAGIATFIDAAHSIAHSKVMIIDKAIVITGSFNFTKAAEERNAENLLIVRSKELARTYEDNWKLHKGHSDIYHGK